MTKKKEEKKKKKREKLGQLHFVLNTQRNGRHGGRQQTAVVKLLETTFLLHEANSKIETMHCNRDFMNKDNLTGEQSP